MENFSTRKCVAKLFPGWGRNNLKKKDRENGGRGIRGGGRIGRGGRRGRGGRGGRGRGRGRG